jgi:hypothetical protein
MNKASGKHSLVIRSAQMATLEQQRLQDFKARAIQRLSQAGLDITDTQLLEAVQRARQHGILGERDVFAFVALEQRFGPGFIMEQDWAVDILSGQRRHASLSTGALLTQAAEGKAGFAPPPPAAFGDTPVGSAVLPCGAPVPATGSHWIELALIGEDDQPLVGEQYRVTLADGCVLTGEIGASGIVRIEGLTADPCEISFPALDEDAWVPA